MQLEGKAAALQKQRARWERIAAIVLTATRNDLDVSQRELALRLGWSRNVIANLETGRRTLTLSDFLLIAGALNINPRFCCSGSYAWGTE